MALYETREQLLEMINEMKLSGYSTAYHNVIFKTVADFTENTFHVNPSEQYDEHVIHQIAEWAALLGYSLGIEESKISEE